MKYIVKGFHLILIGLFTAIILYPLLHEAGHSIMAILVGAKVTELNLLPIPNIVCEVSEVERVGVVLIGLGGMFIPAIISMAIQSQIFVIWYTNMMMRGICLLSFVISFIMAVLNEFGIVDEGEDIIQVIKVWDCDVYIILSLILVAIIIIVYSIIS